MGISDEQMKQQEQYEICIPQWLSERVYIRYDKCGPSPELSGKGFSDDYYAGYRDALAWILEQKKYICLSCNLADCSHHGDTTYVCNGNCGLETR